VKYRLTAFEGMAPKISPALLPDSAAQLAQDVFLGSGAMVPNKFPVAVAAELLPETQPESVQSLWKHDGRLVASGEDVRFARSPIHDDMFSRYYMIGGSEGPMVSGVLDETRAMHPLGVPAPGDKPEVYAALKPLADLGITKGQMTIRVDWIKVEEDRLIRPEEGETDFVVPQEKITTSIAEFMAEADAATAYSLFLVTTARELYEAGGRYAPTEAQMEQMANSILILSHAMLPDEGSEHKTRVQADWRPFLTLSYIDSDGISTNAFLSIPKADQTPFYAQWGSYGVADGDALTLRMAGMNWRTGSQRAWASYDYDPTSETFDFTSYLGDFGGFMCRFDISETELTDRRYVTTFKTHFNEEGPPSDPSEMIAVTDKHHVYFKIPSEVPAGRNIKSHELYRIVSGESSGDFFFVKSIDVDGYDPDEFAEDTAEDEELASTLITTAFSPPPDDLSGLVVLPGGFFAGFTGRTVCFSEVNYPHAWPEDYQLTVAHDIVSLGLAGGQLIVLTDEVPYLCAGTTPEVMAVVQYTFRQACVSARSVVSANGSLFYASPDGLCVIAPGGADLVTGAILTRDQWQEFSPETMVAEVHDNVIYLYSDNAGICFELVPGAGMRMTVSSLRPTALYADPADDTLYAVINDEDGEPGYYAMNRGAYMDAAWRSKSVYYPKPFAFSWARVIAGGYPVRVIIRANGASVYDQELFSSKARQIPVLRRETNWDMAVVARYPVQEVIMATSLQEVTTPP